MDATLDAASVPAADRSRWIGRALTALPALFLAFDAAIKLSGHQQAVEASGAIGLAPDLVQPIGVLELSCLLLYLAPRTAPLGALLLTGYLGGAVAMHVRLEPLHPANALFPIFVGALCWAGLALRDARVRALFR